MYEVLFLSDSNLRLHHENFKKMVKNCMKEVANRTCYKLVISGNYHVTISKADKIQREE